MGTYRTTSIRLQVSLAVTVVAACRHSAKPLLLVEGEEVVNIYLPEASLLFTCFFWSSLSSAGFLLLQRKWR